MDLAAEGRQHATGRPDVLYECVEVLGKISLAARADGNEEVEAHAVEMGLEMLDSALRSGFEDVARVLDGTSDKVKVLHLEPGDLQIFRGRYSLHRVAPLKGPRPRYVAIFSYVSAPNMVGALERTLQLYGRTLPIHHERAGQRADAFID